MSMTDDQFFVWVVSPLIVMAFLALIWLIWDTARIRANRATLRSWCGRYSYWEIRRAHGCPEHHTKRECKAAAKAGPS